MAGRNVLRPKSVYDHPLSGLVSEVRAWHLRLRKKQAGEPFITMLENVASMTKDQRAEFDDVLGGDVARYCLNEALWGGAPRKRFYWTNAPVEAVDARDVPAGSLAEFLKKGGSTAVPAAPGQRLATIVTTNARGRGKTVADYAALKKSSRTGNWVRVSAQSDMLRPLDVTEMALALNLPPLYVHNTNAREELRRRFLGSAFGARTVAHVLACLKEGG